MTPKRFERAAAAFLPALLAGGTALLAGAPRGGARAGAGASGANAASRLDREARQDTSVVTMTNSLDFAPAEVTIRAGETVLWNNSSVLVHTVTAIPDSAVRPEHVHLPDGAEPFGSGRLSPDESYRYTFTVPGTYRYLCIPHETAGMLGTVVVKDPKPRENGEERER